MTKSNNYIFKYGNCTFGLYDLQVYDKGIYIYAAIYPHLPNVMYWFQLAWMGIIVFKYYIKVIEFVLTAEHLYNEANCLYIVVSVKLLMDVFKKCHGHNHNDMMSTVCLYQF